MRMLFSVFNGNTLVTVYWYCVLDLASSHGELSQLISFDKHGEINSQSESSVTNVGEW